MSQFLADNYLWLLVLVLGCLGLWIGLRVVKSPTSAGRLARILTWGPFAKQVENYASKHREFTTREKLGMACLGVLMILVLLLALISA